MLTRREFLKTGLIASAGLVMPWELLVPRVLSTPRLNPTSLAKFVDPLPIPSVLTPNTSAYPGADYYQVSMMQFKQKLHRDLAQTTLWGYNGTYPGPTIEARRGRPAKVKWVNNLPAKHFLPIDTTIHGSEASVPQGRSVVHLHGHKVLPDSDGYPEAWFTAGYAQKGPAFSNQIYSYPNDQQATSLWYHDHSLGITRLNVYAGLAGFYTLRDGAEDALNLPKGDYEIPLLIQDRSFNADGSLLYPTQTPGDPDTRVPPIWIPEFFGDVVLVNGKVWPYLEVEPRKYRFRILNGSNARFYHLTLVGSDSKGVRNGKTGPSFYQIGTDGGLLPAPVKLSNLLMGPAERFDIVVDFSNSSGKYLVLANDAKAPYPDGDEVVPADIMLFKVANKVKNKDTSSLPSKLVPISLLAPQTGMKQRYLGLSELDSNAGNPIIGLLTNAHWDDPVTESPKVGSTEIWNLINTTGDAHPIHVHLVQFQVLERRAFDVNQYNTSGKFVYTGNSIKPDPNERPAWKDTIRTLPGMVTRIIAKYDLPTGTVSSPGQKFRFVWHCHILEHEDNDMMRPYDVVG